jgi:hypothetical protein
MKFIEALAENDARRAKRLVIPEQQSRIDTWMSEHEPYEMEWDWTFKLEEGPLRAGGYCTKENDACYFHATYYWHDPPYCLEIDDITLEPTDKGWQILEWEVVCEVRNYCVSCP